MARYWDIEETVAWLREQRSEHVQTFVVGLVYQATEAEVRQFCVRLLKEKIERGRK